MSDRAAFVAAIEAEPESDLPRLVWADWLEEHGDARDRKRAELIRVQCSRVRTPTDALLARERELLTILRRTWPAELSLQRLDFDSEDAEELAGSPSNPRFRRGCLAGLVFTADDFPTATAGFSGREPLAGVEIHGWRLCDPAPPERLLGLRSVQYCPPDLVPPLAASSAVARLRKLMIQESSGRYLWAPHELVAALADTSHFAGLEWLTLYGVRFTSNDIRTLIASPYLSPSLNLQLHPPGGGSVERRLRNRFTGPATVG